MYLLDCETEESLYRSLSEIFDVADIELDVIAKKLYKNPTDENFDSRYSKLIKNYNIRHEGTCWFHLTRVPASCTFENGLLPITDTIDLIWTIVKSISPKDIDWDEIRTKITGSNASNAKQYNIKLSKSFGLPQMGPYGLLTVNLLTSKREELHYLAAPEIIFNINRAIKDYLNINLINIYRENSKSCIVKFCTKAKRDSDIQDALYIIYAMKEPNCSISMGNLGCFTTRGVPIPKQDILSINFISTINTNFEILNYV
jgi:hypothetical protein